MTTLVNRIPNFSYNPDAGLTFELWYSRYENILDTEGASLDDSAKVRLIVQKLDQESFQKYDAHIMPLKYSEIQNSAAE